MPFEHVIDCDVHLMVPNIYVLLPYLPEPGNSPSGRRRSGAP